MIADRPKCVACGSEAPETRTEYTLISAQYGWRVIRNRRAPGTTSIEWYCPACWKRRKTATSSPEPSSTPRPLTVAQSRARRAAEEAKKLFDRAGAVLSKLRDKKTS
jgi:hypothetical protein